VHSSIHPAHESGLSRNVDQLFQRWRGRLADKRDGPASLTVTGSRRNGAGPPRLAGPASSTWPVIEISKSSPVDAESLLMQMHAAADMTGRA
jgi:hypothetical protein